MAGGKRALGVDHLAKGGGDIVEIILIDGAQLLDRGEHDEAAVEERRDKPGPELVVGGNLNEGIDEGRIEPAAGAAADLVDRRFPAGMGVKHVDHLRQQGDARGERDGIAC